MPWEVAFAASMVVLVAVLDTWMLRQVWRRYRASRRRPHLVLVVGVVLTYSTGVAGSALFAVRGDVAALGDVLGPAARTVLFLGAASSYALVPVLAASVFHAGSRVASGIALALGAGLVALAIAGIGLEPSSVPTPATMRWELRLPFVALEVFGFAWLAYRALRASRRVGRASLAPHERAGVARMRALGHGTWIAALGQVAILGFPEHGRFDTPRGYACIAIAMSTAVAFVVACVLIWATPAWLKARWEAGR